MNTENLKKAIQLDAEIEGLKKHRQVWIAMQTERQILNQLLNPGTDHGSLPYGLDYTQLFLMPSDLIDVNEFKSAALSHIDARLAEKEAQFKEL